MKPPAKEELQGPYTWRGEEWTVPKNPPEVTQSCWPLGFGLLVSKSVREYISVVLVVLVYADLLRQA